MGLHRSSFSIVIVILPQSGAAAPSNLYISSNIYCHKLNAVVQWEEVCTMRVCMCFFFASGIVRIQVLKCTRFETRPLCFS